MSRLDCEWTALYFMFCSSGQFEETSDSPVFSSSNSRWWRCYCLLARKRIKTHAASSSATILTDNTIAHCHFQPHIVRKCSDGRRWKSGLTRHKVAYPDSRFPFDQAVHGAKRTDAMSLPVMIGMRRRVRCSSTAGQGEPGSGFLYFRNPSSSDCPGKPSMSHCR